MARARWLAARAVDSSAAPHRQLVLRFALERVLRKAKERLLLESLACLGIVKELKTDDMHLGLVMTKVDTAQAVTSARAPRASSRTRTFIGMSRLPGNNAYTRNGVVT